MSDKQVPMKVRKLATQFGYSIICALGLMNVWPPGAVAQEEHSHQEARQQELTAEQKSPILTRLHRSRSPADIARR